MSDHDLSGPGADAAVDTLLRSAGAALRAQAPSADEVDAAHARLQDQRGRRSWWIAPTVVAAAAAAVIGIIALTEPEESLRQVPADTVAPSTAPVTSVRRVPTPVTGPTVPRRTVPDTSPPATAPEPVTTLATPTPTPPPTPPAAPAPIVPPATATTLPTTTTPPPTQPPTEWIVGSSSGYDFDGDGGVCLTLSGGPDGDTAAGCLAGEQVRAQRPAYAVFDAAILALTARVDGTGADLDVLGSDEPPYSCLAPVGSGSRLVDLVACRGADALHTFLPATADGTLDWSTTGWAVAAARPTVRPAGIDAPDGVRVIEIVGADNTRCVAVIVAGVTGWREACAPAGAVRAFVAGTAGAPVVVELDASGAVITAAALDPGVAPLANGCRAGIGVLFASLPESAAMTGLNCVDGAAIAGFGRVLVQDGPVGGGIALLRDAGNGTWPAGDTGPSLSCARYAQTCANFRAQSELGEALLPVPPRAVLIDLVADELGTDLLDPRDSTERYAGIGVVADENALYAAVDAAWRSDGDDVSLSSPTFSGEAPLVVTFSRIPDDAQGGSVLVVWYSRGGQGLRIETVIEVIACSRGTTTLEDGTGVCV